MWQTVFLIQSLGNYFIWGGMQLKEQQLCLFPNCHSSSSSPLRHTSFLLYFRLSIPSDFCVWQYWCKSRFHLFCHALSAHFSWTAQPSLFPHTLMNISSLQCSLIFHIKFSVYIEEAVQGVEFFPWNFNFLTSLFMQLYRFCTSSDFLLLKLCFALLCYGF